MNNKKHDYKYYFHATDENKNFLLTIQNQKNLFYQM